MNRGVWFSDLGRGYALCSDHVSQELRHGVVYHCCPVVPSSTMPDACCPGLILGKR